jgi:YD repeat-containing protein
MPHLKFPLRFNDGSTEQFSYQRPNGQKILDLTHFKDRENRWTLFGYDALRQRTASLDPLGRATRFHWCYCGALQDLWDAEGKKTHNKIRGRTNCRNNTGQMTSIK